MRNLKTIRLAAAQQSADAVLIIRSVADTDSYSNYASILYLTIIGWWIVPGTDIDSLVIMRGAMYDVANAYLYLTAEAEGEAHVVGPTLGLRDRDAIDEAKAKALDNFGPEFVKHVEAIAPSSTAQASPL